VNESSPHRNSRIRLAGLLGSVVGAFAVFAACLSAPSTGSGVSAQVAPLGCTVDGGAPPSTAPGGYYTNGGTVCTAAGAPHLFHGVDRPSLEWDPSGSFLSQGDFQLMAGWGANVVRIALNQDFWLQGAALAKPSYPSTVKQAVSWAEAAGLDVILDLHWSDQGHLDVTSTAFQGSGYSNQQPMADTNSIVFWQEVAMTFKGDGHVLFELYNEPHNITWDVWLHGGNAGAFTAAGMQQLYDAVRGAGASNVVIAGGLNWAYDLSSVGPTGYSVHGYNVVYATHPYLKSGSVPSAWESTFGHLETADFAPVIATEFGDGTIPNCTGSWDQQLIQFAGLHRMSWTAWGWYVASTAADPQGCHFPSVIVDWSATPSVQGVVVKAALAGYTDSRPRTPDADAATAATDDAATAATDDASAPEVAESAAPVEAAAAADADDALDAPFADVLDASVE
jgi:endoglucanase